MSLVWGCRPYSWRSGGAPPCGQRLSGSPLSVPGVGIAVLPVDSRRTAPRFSRPRNDGVRVVQVLLRRVDWQTFVLGSFQRLPVVPDGTSRVRAVPWSSWLRSGASGIGGHFPLLGSSGFPGIRCEVEDTAGATGFSTMISTRRFCCRPAAESLSATGRVSPRPIAVMRLDGMP